MSSASSGVTWCRSQFLWALASSHSNPVQFSNGSTTATASVYDHHIHDDTGLNTADSEIAYMPTAINAPGTKEGCIGRSLNAFAFEQLFFAPNKDSAALEHHKHLVRGE